MNAILHYDYGANFVDGSLLNALEYFLAIYEHNKDVTLLLANSNNQNKQAYIKMIYERYTLEGLEGFENNIKPIRTSSLVTTPYDTVAICAHSHAIKYTKGILRAKKILVISDRFHDNPDFFFRKDKYNVTYYGEMPYQYKDEQYTMKMLFSRFKSLPYEEDNILIHSPHNDDMSFIPTLNLPDKPIIIRGRGHVENFFTTYKTFVYYSAQKRFDMSPRLMHEAFFYNKKILYFNHWTLKDGSYYRYNDLMKNGLTNRYLSKDDEIVRQMI